MIKEFADALTSECSKGIDDTEAKDRINACYRELGRYLSTPHNLHIKTTATDPLVHALRFQVVSGRTGTLLASATLFPNDQSVLRDVIDPFSDNPDILFIEIAGIDHTSKIFAQALPMPLDEFLDQSSTHLITKTSTSTILDVIPISFSAKLL